MVVNRKENSFLEKQYPTTFNLQYLQKIFIPQNQLAVLNPGGVDQPIPDRPLEVVLLADAAPVEHVLHDQQVQLALAPGAGVLETNLVRTFSLINY